METHPLTAAYLEQPYARILIPDVTGGYSAEILELPGCYAEGTTPDETMQALERAAHAWIVAALTQGQVIPVPWATRDYQGHIALRLPRSLHRHAVARAQREGVSLNTWLVSAITAAVEHA